MELGQFPAETDAPLRSERRAQILERVLELVRRFVEDHRAHLAFERIQMLAAAFFVGGEEALKAEPPRRQTRDAQRRDNGAGAGNGADADICFCTQHDQILTGVGDGRGARIGDERTALTRKQPLHDAQAAFCLVVLVIAHEWLFDLQMIEQLERHARILGGDEIRLGERLFCPRGDVAEISDGRWDKIERSGHVQPS